MNSPAAKFVLPLFLVTLLGGSGPVATAAEKAAPAPSPDRAWYESLPSAPPLELKRHGLRATELRRWQARGAGQGVAVDANYFYGIGNFIVGKYDKQTGARVGEWIGLRGGPTIHLNSGYVENGTIILAH